MSSTLPDYEFQFIAHFLSSACGFFYPNAAWAYPSYEDDKLSKHHGHHICAQRALIDEKTVSNLFGESE